MSRYRLTRFRILLLSSILVVALAGIAVAVAHAQARGRMASPPANVSAVIDGDHIPVDYYAPSARGRKVMGALVPYGEVWCTGANWATKITTETDLDINGQKLPKGSYSIWTLPGEKEWKLIINKQTGQFHLDYDQTQDFARVAMNLKTLPSPVETFRIEVAATSGNKGTLSLLWENTDAWVPITVLR